MARLGYSHAWISTGLNEARSERGGLHDRGVWQRTVKARPVGWSALPSFRNKLDARLRVLGVDELLEGLDALRIIHHSLPFALVRVDEKAHAALQLFADAQLIVDNHLAQVFDATLQLLQPRRRALQLVSCQDIIPVAQPAVCLDGCFSRFTLHFYVPCLAPQRPKMARERAVANKWIGIKRMFGGVGT